jgi:hypothetical protein
MDPMDSLAEDVADDLLCRAGHDLVDAWQHRLHHVEGVQIGRRNAQADAEFRISDDLTQIYDRDLGDNAPARLKTAGLIPDEDQHAPERLRYLAINQALAYLAETARNYDSIECEQCDAVRIAWATQIASSH